MTRELQKSVYYRPSNTSAADRNCIPPSDLLRRIAYLKAVSKLWMSAMNAISLTFAVALAACTPSPKESAMPSPSSESGNTAPANGTKQKAAVAPPQVALEGIPVCGAACEFICGGRGPPDLVHGLRSGRSGRAFDRGASRRARTGPSQRGHAGERLLRCTSLRRRGRRQILRRLRRGSSRPTRWRADRLGAA